MMSLMSLIPLAIAFGLFLGLIGLQVLGYQQGRRWFKSRSDEAAREGVSVVEGAVFALLGLILAFQFSGAASRLDTRRELAVQEANAIGTAYLRLDLLPPEEIDTMRDLFRQYLESRIRSLEAMPNLTKAEQEWHAAEVLQQTIWNHAVVVSRDKSVAVPQLLLPALNDMIDITAERKAVGKTHSPLALQAFLVGLSLISALLAGSAMSRSPELPRLHIVLFATVIAMTIYFILDMEHPRVGLIRVGVADQTLYDLRDSMK